MVRYRKVNNGPEDYPGVPNEHCESELAQRPSTSRRIRNPRWSTKEPPKRKTVSSDVAADPTALTSTPEETGWPTVLIPPAWSLRADRGDGDDDGCGFCETMGDLPRTDREHRGRRRSACGLARRPPRRMRRRTHPDPNIYLIHVKQKIQIGPRMDTNGHE